MTSPNSEAQPTAKSRPDHTSQPVNPLNVESQPTVLPDHRAPPEVWSDHKAWSMATSQHRIQPAAPPHWKTQPEASPNQEQLWSMTWSPAQSQNPSSGPALPGNTACNYWTHMTTEHNQRPCLTAESSPWQMSPTPSAQLQSRGSGLAQPKTPITNLVYLWMLPADPSSK